ncbi:MAG TPA: PAS domain S-box protein, partial [Candidatus Acidoferrum sp.]|nr:PAS domain S-box protein [Candidatus Acidoferrum sp.]
WFKLTVTPSANGITVYMQDITAQKLAELALQESEQKYRAFFENLAEAIVVIEAVRDDRSEFVDFLLRDINQAALQILGAAPDQVIGKKIGDFIPDGQLMAHDFPYYQAVLDTGDPVSFETTFGGKIFLVSAVRMGVDSVLLISLDITERKQAENALLESEGRFRWVLENSLDAAYRRDLRRDTFDYLSPVIDQVHGFSLEEMNAMTPAQGRELIHPDDRAQHDAELHQAIETGSGRLVYRFRAKSGEYRWLEDYVTITKDADGKPIYRTGILRDITPVKEAEQALQESEARFRILADSNPLIIWVTDTEGGLRFVNRTYREYFGVSLEEVEGGGWQPLVHPDDAPAYLEAFQTALEEKKPFSAEARVRRADGEWRWLASYAEPRFSAEGEFLGYLGNSPDVTERRRYEEKIRLSQERLQLTTEAAGVGGWSMDLTTLKATFDDLSRHVFNLTEDFPLEATGLQMLVRAEDWSRVEQATLQMMTTEERQEVEFRMNIAE